MQLLVRNKVEDFDHWKSVFDAKLEPPRVAGLTLSQMWRSIDDPKPDRVLLPALSRIAGGSLPFDELSGVQNEFVESWWLQVRVNMGSNLR